MANSPDPDQLASEEANWSESTLFAKTGYIWAQQDKVNLKYFILSLLSPEWTGLHCLKCWAKYCNTSHVELKGLFETVIYLFVQAGVLRPS